MPRCVSAFELNALQNLALGFLAEPFEFRDAARFAGRLELVDGLDAELVVHRFDLLGAEAGDLQHLDQAGRDRGLQFLVVGQFASSHQLGDFLLDAITDALDFGEAVFGDQFIERFGQVFQRPRGVSIGPRLERILALEFEQRADLDQNLCDQFFIHVMNYDVSSSRFKVRSWRRHEKAPQGRQKVQHNLDTSSFARGLEHWGRPGLTPPGRGVWTPKRDESSNFGLWPRTLSPHFVAQLPLSLPGMPSLRLNPERQAL